MIKNALILGFGIYLGYRIHEETSLPVTRFLPSMPSLPTWVVGR